MNEKTPIKSFEELAEVAKMRNDMRNGVQTPSTDADKESDEGALAEDEITVPGLWKFINSRHVKEYAATTTNKVPPEAKEAFALFGSSYDAFIKALRAHDVMKKKGEELTNEFVSDLQVKYHDFDAAYHALTKKLPPATSPQEALRQGVNLDSIRITYGPQSLSIAEAKRELNQGVMRSYADMKDAERRGVNPETLASYQKAYREVSSEIHKIESFGKRKSPIYQNSIERLQRKYDALVSAVQGLEVAPVPQKDAMLDVDLAPATPSSRSDKAPRVKGLDTGDVATIDSSDLVGRLNEEPARKEILKRLDEVLGDIQKTLKERGLRPRTNKDLDGYGTLTANARKLRKYVFDIPAGTFQREDAKDVYELMRATEDGVTNVKAEIEKITLSPSTPKTPDAALTPPAAVEKHNIVSFTEMKQLVDTYNARIRNAARANPLAIITAEGSLYTTEYQPLLVTTKDLLKRLEERAGAAAEQDPALEGELATSLERLNELSSTIATQLLDKLPPRPVTTSPAEAVPPAAEVPLARVPGMQGPVQPSEAALQSAIKNGMEKGTLETASALATLREKNETYKNARAAYEKAIDAHYGAYNSGTGTFWEKTRRGVGKFFGVGPKHTPELDALYHAMNDARVDFSKSRFEAMDARIKGRIAQNADDSEKLSKWNEGLKRREIGRTIARSSRDLIERQYSAVSEPQQQALTGIRAWWNKIPEDKRTMMTSLGAATLGAGFTALKTKAAIASGGLSLIAALAGAKAGQLIAALAEQSWNKDIQKQQDSNLNFYNTESQKLDFNQAGVNEFDGGLRERLTSIRGTEEAKKKVVGAVRVTTAATTAMATGAYLDAITTPDLGAVDVPDSPEKPDAGGIEERGGGNGDGKTPNAVPVPESTPLHTEYKMVEGDNPWDLAEEKHFASKFEGMSNTERDHILDTVLDNLGKDAEMRQQVFPGYESNDFTRMPIGQEVNLDLYEKLIDKEIERHGGNVPASPTTAPEPKIETPAPEVKPEPKIEDRLEQEEKWQDRGIETRTAVADAPRGLMNEEPSVNIDDRRSPAQVAADERMYRDLMSNNTSVADASYEGPRGLENEEPSTNVEDLRTPDGKTDLGLSESENSLVDVSTEVDNLVDPKLVAEQRESIVRTLDGKRPETSFFSSLLSTTVNERGAHDVLKGMTLGQIKSELLSAPPQAWSTFAAQNNIEVSSMNRWMDYLKQVSNADTTQDPNMKLDAYLDKVSEHIIKTAPTRAA